MPATMSESEKVLYDRAGQITKSNFDLIHGSQIGYIRAINSEISVAQLHHYFSGRARNWERLNNAVEWFKQNYRNIGNWKEYDQIYNNRRTP